MHRWTHSWVSPLRYCLSTKDKVRHMFDHGLRYKLSWWEQKDCGARGTFMKMWTLKDERLLPRTLFFFLFRALFPTFSPISLIRPDFISIFLSDTFIFVLFFPRRLLNLNLAQFGTIIFTFCLSACLPILIYSYLDILQPVFVFLSSLYLFVFVSLRVYLYSCFPVCVSVCECLLCVPVFMFVYLSMCE